ncbi:YceD family protein [Denitromonas sp.]|uniref:YceD family protein n=1 Tax=Denitromonas sp. TaxID=2734609 RepID=UPI002AFEB94D|nr:YceD family protein [Denitromonas sp.]
MMSDGDACLPKQQGFDTGNRKYYHAPLMSRDSYVIDSLAFAREGRHKTGQMPVSGFERLSRLVCAPSGDVVFAVTGVRSDQGESFLDVEASCELAVRCERCLEVMSLPVEVSGRLLLVPPGMPLPDDDLEEEEFDPIHADSALALLPLVEEEILLGMPFAPRHEQCNAPLPLGGAVKKSPFAVLESLKTGKGSEN